MKKLVVIAAVVAAVVSAKAASVDWNVTGAQAQEGYTVYLLTSIADSYGSVADLAAAAVDSATIAKSGRKYGTGDQTAKSDAITANSMKNAYYAIVTGTDATSFNYVSLGDLSGRVYNPDNQETSPGAYDSTTAAQILAGTSKNFSGGTPIVPEPTSGLLLLVGGAMLALRRKQK